MRRSNLKTKVLIRKLPPSLKEDNFLDAVNKQFEGRYNWCSYHPGYISRQRVTHSRAYVNFKKPEDVFDFSEAFEGHTFVNEKGLTFKAQVEYAPFQKVPKFRSKKDAREATILKDPEYLAFLQELQKPVEHLPSAEIQLEKREAEKAAASAAGGATEGPVITPLMEFILQRRANKGADRVKILSASTRQAAKAAALALSSSPHQRQRHQQDKAHTDRSRETQASSRGGPPGSPSQPPSSRQARPPPSPRQASDSEPRKTTVVGPTGRDKRLVNSALAAVIGGKAGEKKVSILQKPKEPEQGGVKGAPADSARGGRVTLLQREESTEDASTPRSQRPIPSPKPPPVPSRPPQQASQRGGRTPSPRAAQTNSAPPAPPLLETPPLLATPATEQKEGAVRQRRPDRPMWQPRRRSEGGEESSPGPQPAPPESSAQSADAGRSSARGRGGKPSEGPGVPAGEGSRGGPKGGARKGPPSKDVTMEVAGVPGAALAEAAGNANQRRGRATPDVDPAAKQAPKIVLTRPQSAVEKQKWVAVQK